MEIHGFIDTIDIKTNGEALRKCILIGPYTPTIVTTPAVPATEDSPPVPEQITQSRQTSSNTRNKNVDTTLRYKNDNQTRQLRTSVGSGMLLGKPKRVKDSTYHKEKMLLCKQAEKGVQLQAEQSDWLADTDEEIDEQELEAHYSYMAKIQENLGESIGIRIVGLVALQNKRKQYEFERYKAFNDRTVDYDKLERRLNETLGLLAQKEIDIKEGLKVKAYEISVVKEKHDELVKQSLLTKSHYEGLVKEKTKVRIKQNSQENGQTRTRERKSMQKAGRKLSKSNPSQTSVNLVKPWSTLRLTTKVTCILVLTIWPSASAGPAEVPTAVLLDQFRVNAAGTKLQLLTELQLLMDKD
ncbi:hypothetical protein Tco_0032928 [Tanacetum coccineum]